MELYKFIDETKIQKYKGGFVVLNNRIHTNPSEEIVRKAGYKDLVDTPCPEYDKATQYIQTKYVDGDVISVTRAICDIPNEICL